MKCTTRAQKYSAAANAVAALATSTSQHAHRHREPVDAERQERQPHDERMQQQLPRDGQRDQGNALGRAGGPWRPARDATLGAPRELRCVPDCHAATVTPLRWSTSSSFGTSGGPGGISLSTAVNIWAASAPAPVISSICPPPRP